MKSFSEKHLPTKRKSKSTDDLTRITSTSTGGHSGEHRKKLSNNGSLLLIDTTTTSLVKVGEGPAKRGSIHGSKGKATCVVLVGCWLVAGWLLVGCWLVAGCLLVGTASTPQKRFLSTVLTPLFIPFFPSPSLPFSFLSFFATTHHQAGTSLPIQPPTKWRNDGVNKFPTRPLPALRTPRLPPPAVNSTRTAAAHACPPCAAHIWGGVQQ